MLYQQYSPLISKIVEVWHTNLSFGTTSLFCFLPEQLKNVIVDNTQHITLAMHSIPLGFVLIWLSYQFEGDLHHLPIHVCGSFTHALRVSFTDLASIPQYFSDHEGYGYT